MKEYTVLDKVNYPADLRKLSLAELPVLCQEIREFLLDVLSRNPGHLGAGLGVVELTVALHYVFDTPNDKVVWDVGHQAYPHKVLTGRKDLFETLRKWKGLSGFTHPGESAYDAFIAGHASNSISAALGLTLGEQVVGKENKVIAVIGDGAMTGGLAFEGLNNASTHPNDMLIVLNDNNMSIDASTGGLSKYLVDIITSKPYNKLRYMGFKKLSGMKVLNDKRRNNLVRFNNSLKALISDQRNLFEGFSIRYFGPVDGHDVRGLVKVLRDIKDFKGPKLLHVHTIKGKGYKPAEASAVLWHAPGKFDVKTGELIRAARDENAPIKYQDVFGHTLVELADMDEKVVGVTPAMPSGCSMTYMMEKYPDRTFDVGIAEAHAVTFSAGMALEGAIPFCNIYSTFLQRGYDQMIHDVAMQQAPIILCVDRAGLVGEDGLTHQGLYDIPSLRAVPDLTIMSPFDDRELRLMMYTAYKHHKEGPFVIRYPRGLGCRPDWHVDFEELPLYKAEERHKGDTVVFVSYGPIGNTVEKAIATLREKGYDPGLVNLRFVKPLDKELLLDLAHRYETVITVEDGALAGGMGSAVLELIADQGLTTRVVRIGVPDEWIRHGAISDQWKACGMDAESIAERAVAEYDRLGHLSAKQCY